MGVPTFSVRFESQDDFLVEYTDRLRHGRALLPLGKPLPPGTPVRLKVELPDRSVLYLLGSAIAPARRERSTSGATPVRLAMTEDQRAQLEACVQALMRTDEPTPADGGTPVPDAEDDPTGMSVLLVDDSVSMRIELGDALRERGLRVRVAENGLVALSAALKRPPDVILTDVEMPEMDGWTFVRTVRSRPSLTAIPIVFLTRLSDDLSRLKGYRLGVDDYLPKTMAPEEIIARIQGVLARRQQVVASGDGTNSNAGGGLRGRLEHVRLGSLLAFLESERRSGALHLTRGTDTATLHLASGTLEYVEGLGRYDHQHDRVFELLSWTQGEFALVPDAPLPKQTNEQPATPLTYLLMEHARREDEAKASGAV
ncbi:response regulator [Paraliomyxa miuraensis]|uniref:response regulator n=1 Tax=Paraliomyxa miuraensis TaxID=376150 RepID=UPI00224FF7E2|nr:response regulator [Paraliomyxa miuraensis]MCX4244880.1 response regulator [Paraliomyxa miuraensis]